MIELLNCPECGKQMVWQNDFDVEEDEYTGIATYMSCDDCKILVEKTTVISDKTIERLIVEYKYDIGDIVKVIGNSKPKGTGLHFFEIGTIGVIRNKFKYSMLDKEYCYYSVYSEEAKDFWFITEKDLELVQ